MPPPLPTEAFFLFKTFCKSHDSSGFDKNRLAKFPYACAFAYAPFLVCTTRIARIIATAIAMPPIREGQGDAVKPATK